MELRKTYVTRLDQEDLHAVVVRDGSGQIWIETPDGERITDALRQAEAMARDGAAIIDVGGESTRPGARPVAASWYRTLIWPKLGKLTTPFLATLSMAVIRVDGS